MTDSTKADDHRGINELIDNLTVAASGLITDWSDVIVRGYLKGHPDDVACRLGLVADMLGTVRAAVSREQADGNWGPRNGDPLDEHLELVAQFAEHTCDCEWCVHAGADAEAIAAMEDGLR
jgi:hypothetical protein